MSPLWLIGNLHLQLNIVSIVHVYVVWGGLTVVEMSEWAVVVGVSRVVAPFWLISNLLIDLDIKTIIHVDIIW